MRAVIQEQGLTLAFEKFLRNCRSRNLSQHTLRSYSHTLRQFIAKAGLAATTAQLTRNLVRSYIVDLHESGKGRESLRQKLAAIKSFCRWLENEELIDAGMLANVKAPRRFQTLPDVPSEADMYQLLEGAIPTACPERDRVILELLYGSGLRLSEVVGINLDDFQGKDSLLVRGKGKKERTVPIGGCAQRAIAQWLPIRAKLVQRRGKTSALVFGISKNKTARLDARNVARMLAQVAVAKGLPPYHPHQLRHACGTHMHDRGASLQAIAQMLGHANLSTAQIYTRVSTGRMLDVYRKAHPHAATQVAAG